MPDVPQLPYLPSVRKALRAAQTVDQLLAAVAGMEKFREVWEYLGDALKGAIPGDSATPGAVSPDHAIAVLKDIEGVIRTIDQDLLESRNRGLVALQPDAPAARGSETPAPASPPGEGQEAPPATPAPSSLPA